MLPETACTPAMVLKRPYSLDLKNHAQRPRHHATVIAESAEVGILVDLRPCSSVSIRPRFTLRSASRREPASALARTPDRSAHKAPKTLARANHSARTMPHPRNQSPERALPPSAQSPAHTTAASAPGRRAKRQPPSNGARHCKALRVATRERSKRCKRDANEQATSNNDLARSDPLWNA